MQPGAQIKLRALAQLRVHACVSVSCLQPHCGRLTCERERMTGVMLTESVLNVLSAAPGPGGTSVALCLSTLVSAYDPMLSSTVFSPCT